MWRSYIFATYPKVTWYHINLFDITKTFLEINPGPKRTPKVSLSICHLNLNSISAHNYVKLSLLRAYLAFHNFDIICLSEIYLNSSNSPDDETSEISGYNLVHSDHPLNSKRAGVCIYYKNYLPLRIISVNYLSECINFEIMIGNKICNFITLYRSPSQNQDPKSTSQFGIS